MELNAYLMELQELVNKAILGYEAQLTKVVIGRANPNLINKIKINYYDSILSLDEIASISVASPLQLLVKPYDMSVTKAIEKAIMDYKLNVAIANEGHQIRITYPQMTTEKRGEMVKQLNLITEQARVTVRQARQEINKKIKANKELSEDLQKHYLDAIQEEIDKSIKKIQEIADEKEKDLLTI